MRAQIEHDLVLVVGSGSIPGIDVPVDLEAHKPEQLRFDGTDLIDAADVSSWLIDETGARRLPSMHPGSDWQALDCNWDDELVNEAGVWRVLSDVDLLEKAKAEALTRIIARADMFTAPILSSYPEAETKGWDKREAEARALIAAADQAAALDDTLILKALAQAKGWSTQDAVNHAQVIIAKAEGFAEISAMVEDMRDKASDAINAVTDEAQIPAVLETLEQQAMALAQQYGLV